MRKVEVILLMCLSASSAFSAQTTVKIGAGAYLRGPIKVRDEKGQVVLSLLPGSKIKTYRVNAARIVHSADPRAEYP
jgi:hypothetical protein